MTTQYSHRGALVLPPGCSNNPLEYKLTLAQVSLQLIQITPKPTRLKIQMWGLPQQTYLDENNPLCFDIHTSSGLFGQYLRDMRVTVVKMCDSRNNQELGSGLINWSMFLRKLDVNGSPFMLNSFDIIVIVSNYKKKQIAQLMLQASWTTCKKIQRSSLNQGRSQKSQSSYTPKADLDHNVTKGMGIQYYGKQEEVIRKRIRKDTQQSGHQISPEHRVDLFEKQIKKPVSRKQLFKPIQQVQTQANWKIRYPQSQYELQKARLKLEAEQFLTLTQKGSKSKEHTNQNLITVRIDELIINKNSSPVQYLDVSVLNKQRKNRDLNKQPEMPNKKCVRAFPFGKNNSFSVEISAMLDDVIQIDLAKGGKATFQMKSIQQKGTIKTNIYGKNGKMGTINATKIYESSLNLVKQQKAPQNKQKNKIEKLEPQIVATPLPQPTSYMLIRILDVYHNYLPQFDVVIKSNFINKPYPNFSIIPVNELGTIFAIEIRNTKNETVDSMLVDGYSKILISSEGLGCVVIKSGHFSLQNGWVKAELMIGTLKQVNYELSRENRYKSIFPPQQQHTVTKERLKESTKMEKNKYKEKSQKPSDEPEEYQVKKQSISSDKAKDDIEVPIRARKNKRVNRKIYTQMLAMNDSVAIEPSQYRMQENIQDDANEENQENEGVFLVEVLSRFLHALPIERISQVPPTSVEEFFSLLNHHLANRQQKYLIELVTDMFIDDMVEEGQPYRLEYEEFLKCCKSYHNFLELWWRMRIDVLNQLIKSEPNYEEKINRYSELGTISKEALWKKVFTKINSSQLKLAIDKSLRLNAGSTISSVFFIQELKKVQNHPNQPPKQAYPDLIIDLGKLIKQTMESILEGSGLNPPAIPEDKVNIRVMCDTLNKINIGLSYWEALMLIEELKGWYNIDLDCNEGIVSGSVVEIWLKSVLNRSKVSLKAEPAPHQIKTPVNQIKPEPAYQLSSNPSQKFSKPMENKSMAKSQLNEEQIQNIANLLRDNDNFRMGTFTSQKPVSKVYDNNTNIIHNISNKSNLGRETNINKILNDDILDNSSIQNSVSEEVIPRKQPQSTKYLHISIKSIKLRNSTLLPTPFKLRLKAHSQSEHYFLCKSIDEIVSRELVQQITPNWHHKSKGLAIQFVSIDSENGEGAIVLYGMLVNDQIIDLGKQKKNKTVVLYGNKQIVGKVTLQLTLTLEKPAIFYTQKNTNISIQVAPDTHHETQWETYTIKTKPNLHSLPPSVVELKVEKYTRYDISVMGTFYKEILNVIVDGVGLCTVPLEQLYFKDEITGEYPVVTDEGLFVGNLLVTLWNTNGLIKNTNNGMLRKQLKPSSLPSSPAIKYLVIFDTVSTINFAALNSTTSTLSISCNIFIKDAYNRTVLFRSPFYIEHEHQNNTQSAISYVSEFSTENYFIVQEGPKEKVITIELEYDGRPIGIGDQAIKLREMTENKGGSRITYSLKYAGMAKGDILLAMGIRVLRIPESFSKYNPSRIYKTISKDRFAVESNPSNYIDRLHQNNPKLTITERKLTKQLAETTGAIYVLYPVSALDYGQLVSELTQADQDHSGYLSLTQIQQIMMNVFGEKAKDVMKHYMENWDCVKKEMVNYMSLVQFVGGEGEVEGDKWGNEIGSGVAESIDRLHRQIKNKYAVSG